ALSQLVRTGLVLSAIFLSALVPQASFAQTVAVAALNGSVVDTTGALIPGAKITATNTDTGAIRTTVANGAGQFNLPALPVGPYALKVEAGGFKDFLQTGIVLQVGATALVKAVMNIGS